MHRRALTLLAAMALALPAAQAETVTATRLVVADHVSGQVAVFDARTGERLAAFDTGAPARLNEGRHHGEVTLVQSPAGRIHLLETGIRLDGHGDHADLTLSAPTVRQDVLTGPRPSYAAAGDGRLAVFFDGDGVARLLNADGPAGELRANLPHHGIAFPFAARDQALTALSVAPEAAAPPHAIALVAANGSEVAQSPCRRFHGQARSGATIAFGCADGVLLLEAAPATFRLLPSPPGTGDRMVRSLAGGSNWNLFLGDFGPDGLAVIDPAAGTFRTVMLPARRMHFALDAEAAERALAITEDGVLHAFGTLDGAPLGQAAVTGRYGMDGGFAVARPRLSAAGGLVAVSDPTGGRVLIVDAATLRVQREIATGGVPWDVRLVHAVGERH
jgi:hypothetical protein